MEKSSTNRCALVSLRSAIMRHESVVETRWQGFVDVGLAPRRNRDKRLYLCRMESDRLEAYSRAKWGYGRRYVNQLIGAAQSVRHLGASSSLQEPDHEILSG